MIVVTNNIKKIIIEDNDLEETTNKNWYLIKKKVDYFELSLYVITDCQGKYQKIVKSISDCNIDVLEVYNNINYIENKKVSNTEILLSNKDYKKFELFYNNMKKSNKLREEALIEAGAILLSFSCYQDFYLERRPDANIQSSFESIFGNDIIFYKYKDQIFEKSKQILKDKYKLNDFTLIFNEDLPDI